MSYEYGNEARDKQYYTQEEREREREKGSKRRGGERKPEKKIEI